MCRLTGVLRGITLLSTCQGKNELSNYVQELWTLIAAIQNDTFPEVVQVTVLMEGQRIGPARSEGLHVNPTTLDEAVDIVQNADYKFKLA